MKLAPIGTPAFQGEHNREVFRELGVSEAELRQLPRPGRSSPTVACLERKPRSKPREACGSGG